MRPTNASPSPPSNTAYSVPTTGTSVTATVAPVHPASVTGHGERSKTKTREPSAKKTTRALYVDPDLPLPVRFAKLAQRAVDGDTTAKFYAQTLVADCTATASRNSSAFYFGEPSKYRTTLLASKKKACAKLGEDRNYNEIKHFADTHPNDALIQNVRRAIETAFANNGMGAALETGVSAIAARPDNVTVGLVADTFGTLGISNYIATTQLRSTASIPGATRAQEGLMFSALTLLACDYGMPCGPESILVSNGCIGLGQCIPGANLEKLGSEFIARQEWNDTMTLLAFLRQVPAHAPVQ